MRHARGLITTAEALQQVFDVLVKTPVRPAFRAGLEIKSTCFLAQRSSTSAASPATYKPMDARPDTFSPDTVDPSKYGPRGDRPPRDEEIRAWEAYVKLPDGKLSEPQPLQDILDRRERDAKGKYSQFVQELAAPDPGNGRPYSILAYYDKKQMKEQEVALKKKNKQTALKEKGIEVGWSIGGNDLQHRLGRLKEFLEKGSRVEVVLGSTRIRGWGSKRKITEDEGRELLEKFRRAALEVEGTKIFKELEGKFLGRATMSFQGPKKREKEVDGGDQEIAAKEADGGVQRLKENH